VKFGRSDTDFLGLFEVEAVGEAEVGEGLTELGLCCLSHPQHSPKKLNVPFSPGRTLIGDESHNREPDPTPIALIVGEAFLPSLPRWLRS
jgi:hypothetical protein